MNFFQSQSHFVASKRHHFTRVLFLLLLIAVLPVFVWAVMTQRIELRKRAATSEPTQICWNRVISQNSALQWPSSCKGNPRTDLVCTNVLVPLDQNEIAGYNAWVSAGRPFIPGCNMITPTPTVSPTPTLCIERPSCRNTTSPCQIPTLRPGEIYCVTPTPPGCQSITACPDTGGPCTVSIHCPSTPTPTPSLCIEVPSCRFATPPCEIPPPRPGQTYCVTPTPTPTACMRGKPQVSLDPNNQNGNQNQSLTYIATVTNTDTQPCLSSLFTFSYQVDTNFSANLQYQGLTIPAGATVRVNLAVTSPLVDPYSETKSIPVSFMATNTVSNLSGRDDAAYTLVPPPPQNVEFKVKLDGVTGDSATAAKIQVKFMKQDGTSLQLSSPLTLVYTDNGTYTASAVLTNPFPAGTAFTIKIKGEKHIAMKFCRQVGQTGPCADTEFIVVPNPVPLKYGFDLTGIALPPGDLYVQDGRADQGDIDKLTALLSKPRSTLTDLDKLTGDLNYDGVINGFDLNLLLKTLRTRYDE